MANKTVLYSAVLSFIIALTTYAGGELTNTDEKYTDYYLGKLYPNPFSPCLCLEFGVGDSCNAKIDIYFCQDGLTKNTDSMKLIDSPLDTIIGPGKYNYYWDGKDTEGNKAPSGIYYYFIDIEREDPPLIISGFSKLLFIY